MMSLGGVSASVGSAASLQPACPVSSAELPKLIKTRHSETAAECLQRKTNSIYFGRPPQLRNRPSTKFPCSELVSGRGLAWVPASTGGGLTGKKKTAACTDGSGGDAAPHIRDTKLWHRPLITHQISDREMVFCACEMPALPCWSWGLPC